MPPASLSVVFSARTASSTRLTRRTTRSVFKVSRPSLPRIHWMWWSRSAKRITQVSQLPLRCTRGIDIRLIRSGTESETVPTEVQPGQTIVLANPDENTYYQWQNKPTSAQYYINAKGVPASTACQWGTAGNPWGNFAPINLGVGYSNGITYASIFPNKPTTDAVLDFNVKFTGDISIQCKYENGQFYDNAGVNPGGCTVCVFVEPVDWRAIKLTRYDQQVAIPQGKTASVVFY